MTTTGAFADENDDVHYTTYTVKFWRLFTSGYAIIIPFLVTSYLVITIAHIDPLSEKLLFVFLLLLFDGLFAYILNRYLISSKQVLKISIDTDIFYSGNEINQNKYSKNDIEKSPYISPV